MNKFKEIILGVSSGILIISLIYLAFFAGPKTVQIDERHFNCTATEPHGIQAACTQYTMVNGVR